MLRAKHAVRDAEQLARVLGPRLPRPQGGRRRHGPRRRHRADPRAPGRRAARARRSSSAPRCGPSTRRSSAKLLGASAPRAHGSVAPILNANYAELRKAGHYQGAMLHYDGEWYWGIDRLPYLEAALARAISASRSPHVVAPRPEAERGPLKLSDKPLTCELWFSFRSPYSYLALEQIEEVLAPYDVPLVAQADRADGRARPAGADRQAHVHRARRQARGRPPRHPVRRAVRSARHRRRPLPRDRALGGRSAAS